MKNTPKNKTSAKESHHVKLTPLPDGRLDVELSEELEGLVISAAERQGMSPNDYFERAIKNCIAEYKGSSPA